MATTSNQVESILAAAVEIADEAGRRAFLDRACAGDAALRERVEELDASRIVAPEAGPAESDDLLGLDAALDRLAAQDPQAAQLVKLRYFAGLTTPQAAELLGVSPRKADFLWSFARAWLRRQMGGSE